MKLIAFAGRAGSGKNTAAEALSQRFETSELAFADPLYDALGAMMGLQPMTDHDLPKLCQDRDFKESPCAALNGMSPRQALQQLGDWVRATFGADYLIRRAQERLANIENSQWPSELAIITDLRTEQEADWVRRHGGLVVHVTRPDHDRPLATTLLCHTTERTLNVYPGDDYLINSGSPEELATAVVSKVGHWMKRRAA